MGKTLVLFLASLTLPALACEVQEAKALKEDGQDAYTIPVTVARGERCVVMDYLSERGLKTYRELWRPVEKMGPNYRGLYGRFYREFKVAAEGERAQVDRYIYKAGDAAGQEDVVFAHNPALRESRSVIYRITVE